MRPDGTPAHIREDSEAIVRGETARLANPPLFVKESVEYTPYLDAAQQAKFTAHLLRRGEIPRFVTMPVFAREFTGSRPVMLRRQCTGDSGGGLANATLQQRLTAVRLFYDYAVEERLREANPVGRGRYTPGRGYGTRGDRGLLPRYRKLPWIPTDEQWQAILETARGEPLRNRLMLALQYDAALRREELCRLESGDVDPAHRLLTVRAETTKNRQARVVPYSAAAGELYAAYLRERRALGVAARGPLFVSGSRRNRGAPISIWSWSKVVQGIARRADVPRACSPSPSASRRYFFTVSRASPVARPIARWASPACQRRTTSWISILLSSRYAIPPPLGGGDGDERSRGWPNPS
jgi:integrase